MCVPSSRARGTVPRRSLQSRLGLLLGSAAAVSWRNWGRIHGYLYEAVWPTLMRLGSDPASRELSAAAVAGDLGELQVLRGDRNPGAALWGHRDPRVARCVGLLRQGWIACAALGRSGMDGAASEGGRSREVGGFFFVRRDRGAERLRTGGG
jgi:hypothetical protein